VRTMILLLFATVFAGCLTPRGGTLPPQGREACRLETPPPEPAVSVAGPEEGCPAPWVACLDVAAAKGLEAYLWAVRRWQADAWSRCGPATSSDRPP